MADTRRKYTTAGAAYLVLANGLAVVVTGWLLTDPYGWLDGIPLLTLSGALVLAAVFLGLMIVYFGILSAFAVIAIVLERLGLRLTRPAEGQAGGRK